MSQQVKVERDLKFRGVASHTDNVEGRLSTREIIFYDDFFGLTCDTTNDYTNTADAGNTATITVPHCLTLTKDADNEGICIAGPVAFYGNYNPAIEVRMRIDDVDCSCAYMGFNDAVDDNPPASATGATPTITTTGDNQALWLYDKDCTTANWYAISSNATADGAIGDSGHTETDGSWATLRIELEKRGTSIDARWYINTSGQAINPITDFVHYEAAAVAAATALCPVVGLHGRAAGTDTVDVDYIKIWSERY